MSTPSLIYKPPPVIREFVRDYLPGELFYSWLIGPVGSGKTTGIFFKLVYMSQLQAPGPDGIRRTRAVIVRNTLPQLRDTTLNSWDYWFKDGQAGTWHATKNQFTLRFGDVECEVLFRPLDTAADVARVLSLEVTFAIVDEYVEIPKEIIEALSARCGRYPSAIMGGATNWGMWGSSNPSTEDNWWFDYLHDAKVNIQPAEIPVDKDRMVSAMHASNCDRKGRNSRYFLQPSGFDPDAENIENLPGGAAYYTNQAKGKTETWINQFLRAQWGFSIAGKPVVQSFQPTLHLSKTRLLFDPFQTLVAGYDPGIQGTAMVFGQEDIDGRLRVLGEIVAEGYSAERFIAEKLRPYLTRNFPGLDMERFVIAPDPASGNRSSSDSKTVVSVLRKHFNVSIESNNRLPLRLDAIDHFATRITGGVPALLIDEQACPVLSRALKGGWRYALTAKGENKSSEPEKNMYSHPGDSFGYLARYYHRQSSANVRYLARGGVPFVPPRRFAPNYHMR